MPSPPMQIPLIGFTKLNLRAAISKIWGNEQSVMSYVTAENQWWENKQDEIQQSIRGDSHLHEAEILCYL